MSEFDRVQTLKTEKRCLELTKEVLEALARFKQRTELILSDGWCD